MNEITPRWNLPDVSFIETDAHSVQNGIISSFEKITGRTLAAGDPVRLFLLSLADIMIQLRNEVNVAARMNLLSYAKEEYLDAMGVLFAVTRLPAASAKTTFRFTLSQALGQSYTIPKGTAVTNGESTFTTDEELVIAPGAVTAAVTGTCSTPGISGNGYAEGEISTLVSPLPYVKGVDNTTVTSGGSDAEDDANLAERIKRAPNAFSVAGPKKAYEYHTYSVSSSIIDVSVDTPSAGIVNVYPLVKGGQLPSSELLQSIADHISGDTVRPLTDEVHVYAPSASKYTIKVEYWISEEDKQKGDMIRESVSDAVENFRVWQQSKVGRDITPDKLISLVVQAGASRIKSTTLSPASFVSLLPSQVAQCTGVTVNFLGYKEI